MAAESDPRGAHDRGRSVLRWDPEQYGRYGSERARPFFDLISMVEIDRPRRVVDLGCGPGDLTATLADRWPDAQVVGIDSSQEMLGAAETQIDGRGNLRFELLDIAEWSPGPEDDVVVTNAALQWVPGHVDLLRRWLPQLTEGSTFALQVPGNFGSPSHRLMRELAESPQWRERLRGVLRHDDAVAEPADYLEVMVSAGFAPQAWETTYLHLLQGANPVLEWVRGTGLRPVLSALGADAAEFETEYSAALVANYPENKRGTVYPFRRIFAVGVKTS